MTVEAAIDTVNGRKTNPEMPDRKADGTNTAHSVSGMEINAPPTSSIVLWAASGGDIPDRIVRSTFSTTTIASSTTIPTASTRPNSDSLLSEIPSAVRKLKVPSSDTSLTPTVMTLAPQLPIH